jgi:hypothetical protein
VVGAVRHSSEEKTSLTAEREEYGLGDDHMAKRKPYRWKTFCKKKRRSG